MGAGELPADVGRRDETFRGCLTMQYRHKSLSWLSVIAAVFTIAVIAHGEFSWKASAVLVGLCFACELVDSGLGMGYGTILTPTLLLLGYEPRDIVPTVLLSELFSGFAAAFFHHEIKNVELGWRGKDLRPAALLAGGSVAGVAVGVSLAMNIPKAALCMLIGCVILTAGLFVVLLSRKVIEYQKWKMILLATVASFNKAVSGGGYGPLVTSGQILSGVPSRACVGITSFAEACTCLVAVILFLLQGGSIHLTLFIPMCAGALSSVPFAVFAIHKTNEDRLKIVIGVLTMGMGAITIYKGLH